MKKHFSVVGFDGYSSRNNEIVRYSDIHRDIPAPVRYTPRYELIDRRVSTNYFSYLKSSWLSPN